MIAAILIIAALFIPMFIWMDAGAKAEQAAKPHPTSTVAIEQKAIPAAVSVQTTTSPPAAVREVVSYYDSIPLDKELQNYIIQQAHANGIQPQIIMAMIERESDYNITCMGDGGDSYGLMQIQPKWHNERMKKLGCTDLLDPYQNVTVGIDYLCELLSRYDGDMAKTLVSYNQGHYKGTVTAYAKGVLARAEALGGANIYELY
jgi:soluble lytic murein transglycosylase-like protein